MFEIRMFEIEIVSMRFMDRIFDISSFTLKIVSLLGCRFAAVSTSCHLSLGRGRGFSRGRGAFSRFTKCEFYGGEFYGQHLSLGRSDRILALERPLLEM
jgi:hypothetical protein